MLREMEPFAPSALAAQLRTLLGARADGVVMVHVSMRKVGPVVGGAAGLLEALREVLGARGTLLMVLSADEEEPFDARTTQVDVEDMGVFAEVFRTAPGVRVNDHAADRFGALGPDAEALLEPTPLHDYHGPGSVLERFTQRDGTVLRLGANPDTVTLTHYAESLCDVPDKRRARRRYVRADLGEQWIDSLDDTDGIADWAQGDYFPQIFLDHRSSAEVALGPVGRCVAEAFGAKAFVAFATAWMNEKLGGR
jgi:aminoglycoside N3'-acetyltransferase